MYSKQIDNVISILKNNDISMNRGMTDDEIIKAQNVYNITFPHDLKELLRTIVPASHSFYNWNNYSPDNIEYIKEMMMEFPITGILFDVERNNFWLNRWGIEPSDMNEKLDIAKKHLENAPKLIPLYSHRYIPSIPSEPNNPVYSVWQTDIIYYGVNIWNWFEIEFNNQTRGNMEFAEIKEVPFWGEIVS